MVRSQEMRRHVRENAKRYAPPGRVDDIRLQSFSVAYDYPVVFTLDAFGLDNRCLVDALTRREPGKRHRFAVFADDGVIAAIPDLADRIARYAAAHSAHLEMIEPLVAVAGGETCKNDTQTVTRLLATLAKFAIDRHSFAIAIGGGAVLDAVGYAAAIFHRGVRHVRFPTTVLSQCDSGVGVKNAVNSQGLKNQIGTFTPPWAIVNDSRFIDTLPPREKRAGMAEAVKVALIRNCAFFEWIETSAGALACFSPAHLDHLIREIRGIAYAPDQARRRSVRGRLGASAGFRPLVRAQARTTHAEHGQPRRSCRDRDSARHLLLRHGRVAGGGRRRAGARSPQAPRVHALAPGFEAAVIVGLVEGWPIFGNTWVAN